MVAINSPNLMLAKVTRHTVLQSDISAIVTWINNSLLSLQPAKCCTILFTRKRNSKLPPPCITVEGTPLAIVSSVKYLGLQINSDLSWSPHVAKLCIKARKLVVSENMPIQPLSSMQLY